MKMKTPEQIVEKMRTEKSESILGFSLEVLSDYLDFEHAKEFLKPETKPEDWKSKPATDEQVLSDARDYAVFGWGKAQGHRGISASRTIEKMEAYAWLLGKDDVLAKSESAPYAQYGCPKLKVLCEGLDLPVPQDEDLQRMMNGQECTDGCKSGCGG